MHEALACPCTDLEVCNGQAVVLEVAHHLPAGQVPHTQLTTSTTRRYEVTPASAQHMHGTFGRHLGFQIIWVVPRMLLAHDGCHKYHQ